MSCRSDWCSKLIPKYPVNNQCRKILVNACYIGEYQEKNFESTFSRYRDFNSSENLSDVETVLIEEISKELLEDIFNKAFVNW